MFSYFARSLPYRFQALLSSLLLSDSLPFSEVLSKEQIQSVCDEHGVDFGEEQVFTPSITLWVFLSQVIHKEEQRSCLPAVERRARHLDLSQAKRVGKNEYEHTWERPQRPRWMDRATYQRMPETLTLRLIKAKTRQPGFRVKTMMIVTTLLDVTLYPRDEVVALYRQRWSAELDIRAVKVNLNMNDLRCKSPEMVEKEIWICLLAYNLIRLKLLQAAKQHGKIPMHLSFTFGLQTLAVCWTVGLLLNETGRNELDRVNLQSMAGRRPLGVCTSHPGGQRWPQ